MHILISLGFIGGAIGLAALASQKATARPTGGLRLGPPSPYANLLNGARGLDGLGQQSRPEIPRQLQP